MTSATQSKCTHILRENGIHEFALVAASIASYEACVLRFFAASCRDDAAAWLLADD